MRLPASIALAALAVVLSACGSDPSERDSKEVVDRFQQALAGSNGPLACAELSPELRSALEDDEGKPCPEAILGLGLRGGGRAERSRVYITSALVDVHGRGAAFLDQTAHGWRVSAAGCRPTSEDGIYRCVLKD
jgi:hypothetical protein